MPDQAELERPRPGPPPEPDAMHTTVHPDDRPRGLAVVHAPHLPQRHCRDPEAAEARAGYAAATAPGAVEPARAASQRRSVRGRGWQRGQWSPPARPVSGGACEAVAGSGGSGARPRGQSAAERARPWLAAGAGVGRAVHERLAADRRPAPSARPALLAVGVERAVEVPRGAVDVDVERVEAGAALAERLEQDVASVVEDAAE